MKIAIVHDWLVANAGAEKVLKEILELFPEADVFSLVDFLSDKDRKEILKGKYAKTSFIQKLPFAKKYFRHYLPLFPKAIESLDLSKYDLIISSSWAVAKGIKKSKNQFHISYCHTPIRYAWDLYNEYVNNLKQPKKFLVEKTLKYIRKWDLLTSNRVDLFVANSNFVSERIKRIYKRDSIVLYPPVDTEKFNGEIKKDDFYLVVCRLVKYKKVDLIVRAFNQMPDKRLVVIGSGEEYNNLKKIAKNNINLLGYQEDKVVVDYMQKAKAFVYAAIEDFGISVVEAQVAGTPVIALNKGGTKESVINNKTGVLFQNQTEKDIIKAVKKFENKEFDINFIKEHARKFDRNIFKEKFSNILRDVIERYFK